MAAVFRLIDLLARPICFALMMGATGAGAGPPATWPASLELPGLTIAAGAASTIARSCSDPIAVLKAFYDANDASQFDESLGFFTEDASLSTWAEGINGHHMREEHRTGKMQIRPALGDLGLRRTSGQPDGPIYHETKVQVAGDHVTFILEPDRRRPNGKPYNPFKVEAVFADCKIKSLTVIDLVTWL